MDSGSNNFRGLAPSAQQNIGSIGRLLQGAPAGANPPQGGGFANAVGTALGGMPAGLGMPAPMQNPFLGGQPYQPSSVNTTTEQDILRGRPGMTTPVPSMPPVPQGQGAGIPPEVLSRLLQGTPSGANGPYPAQVIPLPFQPAQIPQGIPPRLAQQIQQQLQRRQPQVPQGGLGAALQKAGRMK